MATLEDVTARMKARSATIPTPTLCEALEVLDRKPKLDEAERLTRHVLIDVLCERHPEAQQAFDAWAEADDTGLRDAVPAITTAARAAHLERSQPVVVGEVQTGHGHYDVLPKRDSDDAPGHATHTVTHESGALAGYASSSTAWDAMGTPFAGAGGPSAGQAVGSLDDAARQVADTDHDAVIAEYGQWPPYAPPLDCEECDAPAGQPCAITCIADQARPASV